VDQLIVGGGIANTFLLASGKRIGDSLAEADLVKEAHAIMDIMKARGAEVPLPVDVVVADEVSALARANKISVDDVPPTTASSTSARRPRQALRDHRQRRHHRLERPGRRFRTAAVRRRHQDDGLGHRPLRSLSRSPAAATRWPPSPSSTSPTMSATSRPAAAPSWNSSKARPCRQSPFSKQRAAK
jgi:hypothetical protein